MSRSRAHALHQVRSELVHLAQFRQIGIRGISMAHELRNPLASIALNLELHLDDEADRLHRDVLRASLASCDRMTTILDEFLADVRAPSTDPAVEQRIDALCASLDEPTFLERLLRRR